MRGRSLGRERRADVEPLNPDGDLLAIMMIESTEGVKNADAIAAVPGVGVIFLGASANRWAWRTTRRK
jgi:2-keto-3-deoxy-L-rhamnonate aldolase RhmA